MIPYAFRRLRFTFELGGGATFTYDGADKLTIEGLRSEIFVESPVFSSPGHAVIVIYGLTLNVINKLTIAGRQWEPRPNRVLVEAMSQGETESDAWIPVYRGQIYQAYPMMNESPETPMVFTASPGDAASLMLKPVDPTSIEGSASAVDLITQAAQKIGYTVENNGVDGQLSNPYLKGATFEQINSVLVAVDAYGTLHRTENKVSIWPRDGYREGAIAKLKPGPDGGLIGYPEFENLLIKVRHVFDPGVYADPGLRFEVSSPLKAADGVWIAVKTTLRLSSEAPSGGGGTGGGAWEMEIIGTRKDEANAG